MASITKFGWTFGIGDKVVQTGVRNSTVAMFENIAYKFVQEEIPN